MDADVVIAGGGLAGAATGIALRARGLSVIVCDKAEFPRDKPCGEGLLPHGLELLHALGIGDVVDVVGGQPFRGILYHCHGVVARGDFEGGQHGRGLRRRHFDNAVRDRAAALGVQLVQGTVSGVSVDDDGGTLTLSDSRSLRGRFVVGADGPRSPVRHGLGLDGGAPVLGRYALRRHFRLRAGTPLPERVEVHVGDGHEMYVTPVGDDVVGVAALCEKRVMTSGDGKPAERLSSLIAGCAPLRERLDGCVPDGDALACGPLRVKSKAVWKGRCVLVGDAAGYVDAITGEGMSLALKTAMLAADAIADVVAGKRSLHRSMEGYRAKRWAAFSDHALLTLGLVELARHPFFAKRTIARLAREPALFTRLLAVNNGTKRLRSLGLMDFVKLGVGASPP
ncbi:MAG: NAD(P)/FAD-dependent oxidoreductase [Deltaproteobacteria bacterium]|nr:NAD(P)/FAD-dependent oxidoreductase [Deltaproteobacteria bacterium]